MRRDGIDDLHGVPILSQPRRVSALRTTYVEHRQRICGKVAAENLLSTEQLELPEAQLDPLPLLERLVVADNLARQFAHLFDLAKTRRVSKPAGAKSSDDEGSIGGSACRPADKRYSARRRATARDCSSSTVAGAKMALCLPGIVDA